MEKSELDIRRRQLALVNREAWLGEYVFSTANKLDSSLKKNTAFIKKVRTGINSDQYKSILKDIETVSLEKYISEIITSLSEALFKVLRSDDILAAMEVVLALHQRFPTQLAPYLLINLLVGVANPIRAHQLVLNDQDREKEEIARISRQKNVLRLIGEFYIIGIFRKLNDCTKDMVPDDILRKFSKSAAEPIVTPVLKDVLNFEINLGNSLGVLQAFLKRFQHIIYDENNDLLSSEVKNVWRQIFTIYTKAVFSIQVDLNRQAISVASRNKKAAIRTGKILDEHTSELNEVSELLEKFKSAAEFLGGVVGMTPPKLFTENSSQVSESSTVEVVKQKSLNEDELGGIWDDIREKNFYTKIPTLEELQEQYPPTEINTTKDGEKIEYFLSKLENVPQSNVDQLVVDFNDLHLNNKATRNRILKFLIETPEISNLKYYCRFLKVNESNLSDLIHELIEFLDKGFRSQIYHNKLNFKNIYFFVELIKFKMIPTHIIFHKIRTLTLNITSSNNIDILSVFYEHAGRFLLNETEYRELMLSMISLLKEKKKAQNLTIDEKMAIRNLLVVIDPPITKVNNLQQPKFTVVQQYIRRLIQVELTNKTASQVSVELRRVDYRADKDNYFVLIDCLSSPEDLNYDNIPSLAEILEKMSKKNKHVLARTVDTIIEKIIRGLEENDYRLNRVRMAHIKYISDIFNYKLVNFKFIRDLLYKIVTYGHPNKQPLPGNRSISIDLPDNYFRVQLCCLLLMSIGSVVEVGRRRKKIQKNSEQEDVNISALRDFLIFLQYYTYCKEQPIPMELEFRINDVLVKYIDTGMVRFVGLHESVLALQGVVERNKLRAELNEYDEPEDDEDEDEVEDDDDFEDDEIDNYSDDYGDDDGYDDEDDDEDDDDDDDDQEEEDDDNDDESGSSDGESEVGDSLEDEDIKEHTRVLTETEKIKLAEDKKFADELEEEYKKIVLDSYVSNQSIASSSRGKFSVPIPTRVANEQPSENKGKVGFSLLTKSGKKTNVKQLNLPTDTKFAETILREKANQQEHKERIMNLVMNMET